MENLTTSSLRPACLDNVTVYYVAVTDRYGRSRAGASRVLFHDALSPP
jgi:hypothetical protein